MKQYTIKVGERFTQKKADELIEYLESLSMNKELKQKLIIWIGEWSYRKTNPESKMDIPSIVFEQVEKDLNKFLEENKIEEDKMCDNLVAILQNHVGETGESEGAVEVLERLLKEHKCPLSNY